MLQTMALQSRRATLMLIAFVLSVSAILPILVVGKAYAAPTVTDRALTSTTARPSQPTDLTWSFNTTSDTGNVSTIEIEFCDTPLGACGVSKVPSLSNTPTATLTNFTTNGVTSTTRSTSATAPGSSNNQYTITKTTEDTGQSLSGATISFGATDITNNATQNASYYTRVRLIDGGSVLRWEGVFAQSTSQTLTVNARVQERLDFCVGATGVNDTTTTPTPTLGDCRDITGSTVDIGNVEAGYTNVSPVTTTNGGTNQNGIAMVRTNAIQGVVVDYKAVQDGTSSGKLKIASGTCVNNVVTTDPCFNSAGTTAGTLTAGTERFGMVVAGVNCVSTAAYTCSFAGGTYNLLRDAEYDGQGSPNNVYVADSNQVGSTTAHQYAWDDSGTADRIASSAGSTVKVVDDEALILKFAATAGVTTPTGSYTVQADFIATATF